MLLKQYHSNPLNVTNTRSLRPSTASPVTNRSSANYGRIHRSINPLQQPHQPLRVLTSFRTNQRAISASSAGNGGSDSGGYNGGSNGGGDGWGDSSSGDGEQGFGGNIWVLLTLAAASLGVFGAYQQRKMTKNRDSSGLPDEYDT